MTWNKDRKQTKYGHKRREHMTHTTEPWHHHSKACVSTVSEINRGTLYTTPTDTRHCACWCDTHMCLFSHTHTHKKNISNKKKLMKVTTISFAFVFLCMELNSELQLRKGIFFYTQHTSVFTCPILWACVLYHVMVVNYLICGGVLITLSWSQNCTIGYTHILLCLPRIQRSNDPSEIITGCWLFFIIVIIK